MRKMKVFSVLLSFCLNVSLAHANNFLNYTFQRKDSNSLTITVSFQGNESGQTIIMLPDHWANQNDLYNAISNLKSLSRNTTVKPTERLEQFLISYKPKAKVVLQYNLRKDWTGPLQYPLYFRPVIEDSFFYFEGFSGLVYPQIDDNEKIECQLRFKGFSKNDFIGNSYFQGNSQKKFITTLKDLRNSIFCGGNYRHKEFTINKNKIVIALSGNFLFDDEDYFSAVSKIIIAEKKFWSDFSTPYFFTMLLPMEDKGNSGGTAHYNSFSAFQSNNLPLERGLEYIISHEFFHTWIGQGLRMPEPEELYKWFQEGFTDYYAYKNLRNIRLLTENAFENKLNQILISYYLSSNFATANKELIGNYWKDPSLKQLSYQRGLTIAFLIDEYLSKNKTTSLDDFMRELYSSSKPNLIFSKKLFDQLLSRYGASELQKIIDEVNNGNNFSLSQSLKQNNNYVIKDSIVEKKFDLGFNFTESKNQKKIVGLKSTSNAALAGLKEGMDMTGFSFSNNDTEKTAKIQVLIDGEKKWIEFLPVENINQLVPQIVLTNKFIVQ